MLREYNTTEELTAHIKSDALALQVVLEDMHGAAPPYRLHAAIILVEHLLELADRLENVVSETVRADNR